jgi:hypothetical protein
MKLRVKPWEGAVTVAHPATGQFVVPDRSIYYTDDDPLVQAHRWLFATDAEINAQYDQQTAVPTSVPVGEKRRGRRPAQ